MDVKLINPFVESLLEVTETMAQLSGHIGKAQLKVGNKSHGIVSGYIRLHSPNTNGSLSISFSEAALLAIYERMLGEPLKQLDDSAYDLVGELTNMVCGGAKRRFSEQGLDFDLATPDVIKGDGHELNHLDNQPVVLLPFRYEMGEIYIEVCLNR
ncbi:chemotaxis protein CheX [Reinekea sp.]|jgi:chemotaxis protein CheX|uniref:chemotaxis protein CheX n=1 Tax=Reinekea sp. TaxID=1970455 RepID=UPI00398A2508